MVATADIVVEIPDDTVPNIDADGPGARDIQLDNGRKPVFIKAQTSENAVAKAYEVIRLLSPDFVTIHNGFGFDMKRLAAHSSVYAHVSAAVMKDGLATVYSSDLKWINMYSGRDTEPI
ncbi:hypothetical protein EDB80DRAFT_874988 [Ilyonectria destructans]|nr:hypothetical protein EDB80DRAFT_870905 [Ilyonectria destructans]KAH6980574.1 hypothetical protein EDB80DRAFT_874988 [Ilyonectria destructans]